MDAKQIAEDVLSEFALKIGMSLEQMPPGHVTIATRAAEYLAAQAVAKFAGTPLTVLQEQTSKRALLNLNELQWTGRAHAGKAMIEATESVLERYTRTLLAAIIAAGKAALGL